MHRSLIAAALAAVVLSCDPSAALACSKDDAAYFDSFPDASCLLTLESTEIDTFGGLRLVTDGAVTDAVWDTDANFANGISYESKTFPPLEHSGLDVVGTEAAARLQPSASALPLNPAAGPGLSPAASTLLDTESVADPAVIKVGAKYVMYYAGTAEDGSGPAIFRLESATPTAFTRPADYDPVLQGTPGEFDQNGVYGPDVVYDVADADAPYKMWFTGRGDTFDQIGYATSTDGITWTKHPDPVLTVGLPGSQDSFSAAHPSVLFDSGLWKMWYEGDDSNKKSIHYATSTDGIEWSKAGAVIEEEDGSGNTEFGVFAPTVWRSDEDTLQIVVGGRKETSTVGVYETKLIPGSSEDGIEWALQGAGGLNPGSYSNLNSPEVLIDGTTLRLYFSADDANDGDPYPAIDVTQGLGGNADNVAMLDHAPYSAVFDARAVSGVAAVRPGGVPDHFAGAYTGWTSAGVSRLAGAHSSDGHNWIKDTGPILALGTGQQFDRTGHRDPALVYRQNGVGDDDFVLYFAGIGPTGIPSIGFSTADEAAITKLPDHATWTDTAQLLAPGAAGTFDERGLSHPSVDEPAPGTFWMYYTATSAAGVTTIARAVSSALTSGFATRTQITLSDPECAPDGFRDPVVDADSLIDVELYYVGLEDLDSDSDGTTDVTIQRTCHAHSDNGLTFTPTGVILNPSRVPYAADETGVAPVSLVETAGEVVLSTTVTDREGRTRGSSAKSPVPVPADWGVPSGWATYQIGDASTAARDFRSIAGVSSGAVELWMSILQPYSDANTSYWSDYFPADAADQALDLNFLLTIKALRWQVRMRRVDETPTLDKVTIGHAPVHFAALGTATTEDITPPEDFALQSWATMTVDSELFAPLNTGTGGGSVTVLDPDGNVLVAATPLTVPGETTVPLSGIDAAAEPALRVKFELTSATGQASPIVRELKVAYTALEPGTTPPPDGDGDGVPDNADACPTVAAPGQANGCPPPPPDADGDGIPDAQDACPSVAAAGQPNGCPPDADQDGVPDATDACPAVAAAGSPNGCPIAMTLAASKLKVVYGGSTELSGTLLRGTLPVPGQMVTVSGQAAGTTAPMVIGTAVTDIAGKWVLTVKPTSHTVYSVVLAGVVSPAAITVQVAHKITLKASGTGARRTFTGKVSPRHAKRTVTIQRKSGTRWVRVARVRTTRRSTYRVSKSLIRGKRYRFRAITGGDAKHLKGTSRVIRVRT